MSIFLYRLTAGISGALLSATLAVAAVEREQMTLLCRKGEMIFADTM